MALTDVWIKTADGLVRADQVRRVQVLQKEVYLRLHPEENAVRVGEMDVPGSIAADFVNWMSLEARRTDESGQAVILYLDTGVPVSVQAQDAGEYGIS